MSKSLSQIEAKTMRPTNVRASVGSKISGSSLSPILSVVSALAIPAVAISSAPASSAAILYFIELSSHYLPRS
jgi:hypothetical protein